MEQILNELTELFRSELENNSIVLNEETTAGDIEEWDSLTHIYIIVAIEKKYKIRFSSSEIAQFKNVGDMAISILNKIV